MDDGYELDQACEEIRGLQAEIESLRAKVQRLESDNKASRDAYRMFSHGEIERAQRVRRLAAVINASDKTDLCSTAEARRRYAECERHNDLKAREGGG